MEKNEQKHYYPGVFVWGKPSVHRAPHILILKLNPPTKTWSWCQKDKVIRDSDICFDIKSGHPVPYAPDMMNEIDWSKVKIVPLDFDVVFEYDWRASSAKSEES